ncbi:MAG TPA: cysteine desulfurase-like protein [Candidatus Limnocylindrales bacterium]
MPAFDVEALRRRFPALAIEQDGRPVALFDGPGGTQVPDTVIEAVARYYRESNANSGGSFLTSERSDAISAEAHEAAADMIGAGDAHEITFGPNMTTLTFHLSRSIAAALEPGDEIVLTGLDHHANVDPWLGIARDRGLGVRTWEPRLDDCTLRLEDLEPLLGPRTRLVCVGWASNAVGTINPVAEIVARAHDAGAWTFLDAVHAAPHLPIDVQAIGTDFLACSAYKFFGPHQGILYGRSDILDALPTYKLEPAHHRFETGTQSFEGQAGTLAAIEYLASVGVDHGSAQPDAGRRERVRAGMSAIRAYEMALYERLAAGLEQIPGLRLHGITDRAQFDSRTPTAAVTVDGTAPGAIAEALGRQGIAVWAGDFYATGLIRRLGLEGHGGVLRIGLTHYNTADEVDRLVGALASVAEGVAVA